MSTDYYEQFSCDVEVGKIIPEASNVQRNSGRGMSAILEAAGAQTWGEVEVAASGVAAHD